MTHLAANGEPQSLAELTRSPDYGMRVIDLLPVIAEADSTESAMNLFRTAVLLLGADAGVVTSYLRDDTMRESHRSLLACDAAWASEYAQHGWCVHDPWLRHAIHETEPTRTSELKLTTADEAAFIEASATFGFASAVIAPAPSGFGRLRVGVLCLGSKRADFFDDEGYGKVRVLARTLAMELHGWMMRNIRRELLLKSRLTTADIELLRHEAARHSSKVIGAAMNVEAKTIDCRFKRVCAKLEAPDRRTAARIAQLYGVL